MSPQFQPNAVLIAASPELRDRLADLVEYVISNWSYASISLKHSSLHDAKDLLTRLRNAGA